MKQKLYYEGFRTLTHLKPFLLAALILSATFSLNAQNELNVLKNNWLLYSDAPNSLYHYLTGHAYDYLDVRNKGVDGITTLADWQKRQEFIKETLLDIVGPFPEKTPLNAKVIRTVEKDYFRVEHIVFESQPGFYVTSSMFIPKSLKRRAKAPVVIYVSGHSDVGYRSGVYQTVILNLVKKNFIVFAFDPVGQGERIEYYDPEIKKSRVGGPTAEHSQPGSQAFITGSTQAKYMIWDGIRAVDYLLTRKEVDPARIGITGRSGGGTQSSYIAAMDERIYAVAPENYLTNFTRLLQTIGPQDAEQNMFNMISRGLDHPDYLIVRAPKPALMITTTRDMFSIQGVIETEKQVARIYSAYGKSDNFSRTEDDAPHASTEKNRIAMYAFFQKHLNNPGSSADEVIVPLSNDEIQVTPTGQVSTSLNSETVFSLNMRESEKRIDEIASKRSDFPGYLKGVTEAAKKLSGYREPNDAGAPVFTGRVPKDNYTIEKYFIKGEGDYVFPYLLFVPANPVGKALIYIHPAGKAAEAAEGGKIEWFVKRGITVLAPDMIGVGETGPGSYKGDAYIGGYSHNVWYGSILIGRSIAGIRAGDVNRLAMLLKRREGIKEIYGLAHREMSPVLLHAAAFNKDISRIALIEPYLSYRSIVTERFYESAFIQNSVPAALKAYDLPDLAAVIAPAKLLIAGPLGGNGKNTGSSDLSKDLEVIQSAYKKLNSKDLFFSPEASAEPAILFSGWID